MPTDRYSVTTRLIHWTTAVLVLIAFIYGPGGSETRVYSVARDFDRQLHETLGLAVFLLSAIRLGWRPFAARPPVEAGARWLNFAAASVQATLYLLLFAVPLTAILGAWLEGHPLTLLAGVKIASPLAESHAIGAAVAKVHTWLGDAILWLAGFHAAAALFHHYVLRDDVLRSMLPALPSSTR